MRNNVSIWILVIEILAVAVLHINKNNSEKIKDILLKRNHSSLIKAVPISQSSQIHLHLEK